MKIHTISTIALVALLITVGAAAAAPGNAPAKPSGGEADHSPSDAPVNDPEPNENASDDAMAAINDDDGGSPAATAPDPDLPENASDNASAALEQAGESNENAAATDGDASATNAQGPAEALPDQSPNHVTELHDVIRQFLAGDLDGPLGQAVNSIR